MQSARKIFRRASMRLRRSSSRHVEEVSQQSNDDQENSPAMADTAKTPPVAVSADSTTEGVSSELSGSEMVAAAYKLTDSDSSTEYIQVTGPAPNDAINQLLMKQRRELMYELRTIQHSHRPVSKGDQRRLLERFFRQHLHGDVSDTTSESSNEGNESSRHRRNGVILMELEGLSQQRSVTRRLQSETFRHRLENMVRGTLSRQQNEVEAALRLRSAGLPTHSRQPLVAEGGVTETDSHVSGFSSFSDSPSIPAALSTEQQAAVPVAPPLPAVFGPSTPPQPPPLPTAQPAQPRWQHTRARQLQPTPQPRRNNLPQAPPPAPWLLQNRQHAQRENHPTPSADVLRQAQRESIITEISQLVHRQLVQETLESDFRGTLEYLMTNRLQSMEADGGRVMNFIHSIQQSRLHRRNDFSHLGIHVPSPHAEPAVAGAGAAGAHPAAFMQEMESLRSRMDELHQMVRMSMEMQLDLQRAIRQEVAGALHQQHGSTPSSSAPPTQPAAEGNCVICLDKEVDSVLYQCGHMCVCLTCGLRLSSMGSHCPMCRAPIRDVIRAYRTQRN